MAGPWEAYATDQPQAEPPPAAPETGPWQQYAVPRETPPDLSDPAMRDHVERSYIGGIWNAFTSEVVAGAEAGARLTSPTDKEGNYVAAEPRPLGLSSDTVESLRNLGLFRRPGQSGVSQVLGAANEVLFIGGARVLDGFLRAPLAVAGAIVGGLGGLEEAGVAAGLPIDVAHLPDAFMGSPHFTGIPHGTLTAAGEAASVRTAGFGGMTGTRGGRIVITPRGAPETPGVTSIPEPVARVLADPAVKEAIDNPQINRSNDVPYEAGASEHSDVTNVDRDLPTQVTVSGVTFDPAVPANIHEQVEKHVMERLIAGGMEHDAAYRVAHWEYAEPAEDAWYQSQGIDVAEANKWWESRATEIQRKPADNPPPDLYDKPYPHDSISLAKTEGETATPRPSNEEMARADRILHGATAAFHGSPHTFEQFGPLEQHVGTGEGAQAYGHGYYFAESEGIARHYHEVLSEENYTVDGKNFNVDNPLHRAAAFLYETNGDRKAAIAEAEARQDPFEPSNYWRDVLSHLKSDREIPPLVKGEESGALYRVRINADPEQFLDWDKPLSEQPPRVIAALDRVRSRILAEAESEGRPTPQSAHMLGDRNVDLETFLEQAGRDLGEATISEMMHEAGIPGIKYLDAGSRAEGTGTRNYVVFDHGLIDITHRNGERLGNPLQLAKDLGVIGEGRKPLTQSPPAEAAKDATTPPQPPGTPPPGEKGGPPPEQPSEWRKRFEHFLDRLETSDDVKALIRNAVDRNDEFPAARAGDIPLRQISALSEASGIEPSLIDGAATSRLLKNDNEVRNAIQAMLTLNERMAVLSKQIAGMAKGSEGELEALAELQKVRMQHSILSDAAVEQVVGLRAEWGRTGNVIQEFMKAAGDSKSFGDFLKKKKGETLDDLRDMAKAIAATPKEEVPNVVAGMRGVKYGKFYWYWINNLISGILTHTKYVAANALYYTTEHGLVTPLAAVIGKAKLAAGIDMDRVMLGEGASGLWGGIAAVPEAIRATAAAVRSGMPQLLESEAALQKMAMERGEKPPDFIKKAVAKSEIPTERPISGIWGRIIGAPGDVAQAIHTTFKILGEQSTRSEVAYRAAAKEATPGTDEFWQRMAYWRANPTQQMATEATVNAYKGTFMSDLGTKGKAFARTIDSIGPLKWIFPFRHIPINLMKATYEATPFAFLDSEMRATLKGERGGVEQDKAIARMFIGSSIMAWFAMKAFNGEATGDYPSDPKERDAWNLAGKQPNSIRIGDWWVSFDKFGPAGDLANIGANVADIARYMMENGVVNEDSLTEATWRAAQAAGHLAVNEVGMQSLQRFFEALEQKRQGASIVSSFATSFLPYSSMLSQTASGGLPFTGGALGDPYMREAKTFTDMLRYRLPGLRETLPPKRSVFGEPVANPQYGNILRSTRVSTDPVAQEMISLQIPAHQPEDRIGGVKLTPGLTDEYRQMAGMLEHTMLTSEVSLPGWSGLPPYVRRENMLGMIKAAHETASAAMQMRHPELIMAGLKQQLDYLTGVSHTPRQKSPPASLQ